MWETFISQDCMRINTMVKVLCLYVFVKKFTLFHYYTSLLEKKIILEKGGDLELAHYLINFCFLIIWFRWSIYSWKMFGYRISCLLLHPSSQSTPKKNKKLTFVSIYPKTLILGVCLYFLLKEQFRMTIFLIFGFLDPPQIWIFWY